MNMAMQTGGFGQAMEGKKKGKKQVDSRTLKRVGSVMASMQKPKGGKGNARESK